MIGKEKTTGIVDGRWLVLLAVGVGTFMSALDSSVVNIILPDVNQTFSSSITTIEWVVTVYLLIVSGTLLGFGRLGDLKGHKQVYIGGFGIFIVASMLCGLATSPLMLIAFRAIQAVGGAILFSNSPAILTENFPAVQRGQVLGLQATMTYLGLTVGPSLGGWLASQFSWRAVFYINVPVGILALVLSIRFIPRVEPAQRAERFDLLGAATFLAGLVALILALNQATEWGWTSLPILSLLVTAGAFLVIFIQIERRVKAPMLDLTLFHSRPFTAAVVSALLNYICLYCVIFLMPFYLIQGRHLTELQAGVLLTAQPVIMAIAAPISGTLSDRIGPRLLGTIGMLVLGVGLFVLSRADATVPLIYVAAGLAIAGLGTGTFITPNSSALMGSAPRNRQGIASGMLATARNVGMVTGVGLAGAIFTTVLAHSTQLGSPTPQFDAISAAFLVGSAIALIGVFTSATRGKTDQKAGIQNV